MSFDTTAGTRGGRLPRGLVFRWGNQLMASRIGKGRARFLGFNALVLTTIGHKTGIERTTPVGWFPGPGGSWLIVASANGAKRNPAWYYNLAGHPDQVQIEVDGRKVAVTAEQLHGPEREQAWQQITTAAPRFTKYQVKTDRQLPIIRLTPRSGPEPPPE
jgi:deazaflavin-dependent oxidoreductase (nitroreductase family)